MSDKRYKVRFFEIDGQKEFIGNILDRKEIAAFLVPKNQGLKFKKLLEVLHEKQAYKDWVKDKPPYIKYDYVDQEKKHTPLRSQDQFIDDIFEKSFKKADDNKIDTIFILLSSSEKEKRKSEKRNSPDRSGMKSTPNKRKFKF